MPGGVHTPLHLPQVRQDRRRNVMASSGLTSCREMCGVKSPMSRITARSRRLRHFRVAFFVGLMARNVAAHANSLSANSRSANPTTTPPRATQDGEQITRPIYTRAIRSGQIVSGFWVNHVGACHAGWRPRKDSVICPATANAFTPRATSPRQTHEHVQPILPRRAGCARGYGLRRGGGDLPPPPQPFSFSWSR